MVGAWIRLIVNSAVVAAVVAAAQLGAGDALGIIGWVGPHDDRAWTTLLTWIAFAYAVAVLAGALMGRSAFRRAGASDGVAARLVGSLAGAIGGAAVIGLAWLPAQEIRPPVNVNPGLVVSITAGAGVLVGLVLAVVALSVRALAAGLLTTVLWVWLLAIGAAIAGLASQESYPVPRVAVPDVPSLIPESDWTGPRAMIIAAALLGVVVAGIGRWRRASRLGVALSGFGGPALIAAAYLIAGPGKDQSEPYLAALLATAAGLAASVVVAIPSRPVNAPRRDQRAGTAAASDGPEPTPGDVLVATRAPVSSSASPATPARPSWAEGSGPFARAYTSGSAHGDATPTTRGTGWDADTLAGTTHATPTLPTSAPPTPTTSAAPSAPGGRRGDRPEGGGLYRSTGYSTADETPAAARPPVGATVMGQPSTDPHESWLRELGSTGRHAAAD